MAGIPSVKTVVLLEAHCQGYNSYNCRFSRHDDLFQLRRWMSPSVKCLVNPAQTHQILQRYPRCGRTLSHSKPIYHFPQCRNAAYSDPVTLQHIRWIIINDALVAFRFHFFGKSWSQWKIFQGRKHSPHQTQAHRFINKASACRKHSSKFLTIKLLHGNQITLRIKNTYDTCILSHCSNF